MKLKLVLILFAVIFSACQSHLVKTERKISRNERIMGSGTAQVNDLAGFLVKYNPEVDPKTAFQIASLYIEEADKEGVDHDIAFVQMCLETGFLKYGNQVKKEQHNFAGLGALDSGEEGASFPNPQIGIRAHIQHLKAYATQEKIKQDIVDPRMKFVTKGSAPRVIDLTGKWASDPSYGDKILQILEKLYRGK
ncbi:MAG: hypothetical protein A2Y41_09940 [Spirochaetes bacterium GWB1_36_13]|nr:MAG: hypothetical protein A2Y41_09940 [Spirochaetes bacterium GWB1_36_13]